MYSKRGLRRICRGGRPKVASRQSWERARTPQEGGLARVWSQAGLAPRWPPRIANSATAPPCPRPVSYQEFPRQPRASRAMSRTRWRMSEPCAQRNRGTRPQSTAGRTPAGRVRSSSALRGLRRLRIRVGRNMKERISSGNREAFPGRDRGTGAALAEKSRASLGASRLRFSSSVRLGSAPERPGRSAIAQGW